MSEPTAISPELARDIERSVAAALAEDVGTGDVTAALIPGDESARARVLVREAAVLCGQAWFDAVYRTLDPSLSVDWLRRDGERIDAGEVVCRIEGPARSVLTGERCALNFLQLLSGTATVARSYADAVASTSTVILDTRKTLPGLRLAQKHAVRCGGCRNHRLGLFDAMLIKENHIAAAGSIAAAVSRGRELNPGLLLEVEVESLEELDQAIGAGADVVMLDNFELEQIREAVGRTAGRAKLEVSGNVEHEALATLAATGVDYISSGALTKNVRAIDFSMRIDRPA